MTLEALALAIKGGYEVFKQARRTFWHATVEMMRGNLQRKRYPGFEKGKPDEKKPADTGNDGPACGDV